MTRRSSPPPQYAALDDFLWRNFDDRLAWTTWVAQWYTTAAAAGRDYKAATELQGALRALEYVNNGAEPNAAADTRLDALIGRYSVRPRVRADGSSQLAASSGPVADLLVTVLTAMNDGSWKRFKRCRDQTCTASFYDVSKSATRAWCSMGLCGARAKMRRYRGNTS